MTEGIPIHTGSGIELHMSRRREGERRELHIATGNLEDAAGFKPVEVRRFTRDRLLEIDAWRKEMTSQTWDSNPDVLLEASQLTDKNRRAYRDGLEVLGFLRTDGLLTVKSARIIQRGPVRIYDLVHATPRSSIIDYQAEE